MDRTEHGLRILKMGARNIMRLTAVEITPTGDVIRITGRNGAGKSCVLGLIDIILGGGSRVPLEPIRRGQTEGDGYVVLGRNGKPVFRVEKHFTLKRSYLEVTAVDGTKIASPQAFLQTLYNEFMFDPLEFSRMTPAEQRDVLLAITGLGPKLAEIDKAQGAAANERTEAERQRKQAAASLATIPEPDGGTPAEPVSVTKLMEQLKSAQQLQAANDGIRDQHDKQIDDVHQSEQQVENVVNEIAEAEAKLIALREREARARSELARRQSIQKDGHKQVAELQDPDIAAIESQIAGAESINERVSQKRRRVELQAALDGFANMVNGLNQKIKDLDSAKRELLMSAKWPVPGLGFGSAGVTLNELPFEQASTAEKIRASCAIGMATNPTLRVMRTKDGSLLDPDSLNEIKLLAGDQDYQHWIEQVDVTGKIGIVIEDGTVVAVNEEPPGVRHETVDAADGAGGAGREVGRVGSDDGPADDANGALAGAGEY